MSNTFKAYQENLLWNLAAEPSSPAAVDVLLNPSSNATSLSGQVSMGGHTYIVQLTGAFNYSPLKVSLNDASGVFNTYAVYRDGAIWETRTSTIGLDVIKVFLGTDFSAQIDTLQGNDAFIGSSTVAVCDYVRGEGGNDTFTGYDDVSAKGGDYFYGGTGIDTSVYLGRSTDYSIVSNSQIYDAIKNDGTRLSGYVVTDKTVGRDGSDRLFDVERLQFTDTNIALDYQAGGHAGQAYRLYLGVLGRQGEPGGLGYVMNRLDQGETLKNVASGYLNSPEFQVKYGNADQATFINLLYKNILGRAADSSGTTFINNWIAGGATREDVTLGFTESPEYIAQCATLIGNSGIHYTPVIG